MATALITGATAGIGHEFADQLASRGHDVVLVARDIERLHGVADELRSRYAVSVEVLPADLSDRDRLQVVAERVADPERPVDLLVNNAGFALGSGFGASSLADEERLLDVLVRAVLVLSHAAVPAMTARGHGAVLNVSSVAGFLAMGTYSAAKSWVTVFTESLAAELAGTGVTATALCPGFTRTEFHERAGLSRPGPGFLWLDTPELVSEALSDVAAGRVLSVPGGQYRAMVGLLRVVPRSLVRSGGLRRPGPTPGRD